MATVSKYTPITPIVNRYTPVESTRSPFGEILTPQAKATVAAATPKVTVAAPEKLPSIKVVTPDKLPAVKVNAQVFTPKTTVAKPTPLPNTNIKVTGAAPSPETQSQPNILDSITVGVNKFLHPGSVLKANVTPEGGMAIKRFINNKFDTSVLPAADQTIGLNDNPMDVVNIIRTLTQKEKAGTITPDETQLLKLANEKNKNLMMGFIGGEAPKEASLFKTPLAEDIANIETKSKFATETKNKVSFPIYGTTDAEKIKSVITNSERIKNELSIRGKDAYVAGQGLSANDLKLAGEYEKGVPIADLATQAESPAKFKTFMNKVSDYYDFRLAADRAAGGNTGQIENYMPHQWNLSNPEDLKRFNDLAKQKGLQEYKGFKSQPRVFDTYAEGEAAGFKRANPNALEDLKSDYQGASNAISKQVLKSGLQDAVPKKVNMSGFGITDRGKPFLNSNAAGLEGLSIHPDISNMFQGFEKKTGKDFIKMAQEEAKFNGTPGVKGTLKAIPASAKEAGLGGVVGTLYDHANQSLKHLILNLSGFHSLNVSASFAGASLFNNPAKGVAGLIKSIPSFMSEGFTQAVIDGFKSKIIPGTDMSVFDAGLRAGVNMDRGLPAEHTWLNANLMKSLSTAMFDRELHTLKLNLVDQVFGSGKVAPESIKGQALGKEINMIMGELNDRTMNINPNTEKWLSRALLAPQFTISKYKVIGNAITQWGKEDAGSLARKAVIGKSVVVGTIATLGTLLATGKFPNLHQILLNYSFNPITQTNLQNTKGEPFDIGYPKTFVDEPLGMIQDPGQYLRSRLAPALSDVYEAAPPSVIGTGKNYYGAPIYNPKSKVPWLTQEIVNTVANDLPIGAQNIINQVRGLQTGAQTLIGIGGLSTHIRPKQKTSSRYTPL